MLMTEPRFCKPLDRAVVRIEHAVGPPVPLVAAFELPDLEQHQPHRLALLEPLGRPGFQGLDPGFPSTSGRLQGLASAANPQGQPYMAGMKRWPNGSMLTRGAGFRGPRPAVP